MQKKEAKIILKYVNSNEVYSDGDVENDILNLYKSKNFRKKESHILNNNPNWPMQYHLSPVRENLLSWYEFDPNKTLLEIGAGCGALTGMFCDKLKKVTAIELTKRRSEIIFNRHRDKKNLTIIAGNLNDIELDEKFDYVTLIGVLEYSGKFTRAKNPFEKFLKNVKKYLKKNGEMIIAIENKFGLKYWSGCKEDHTGRIFDSIEGYPKQDEVRTFGKDEIKKLLKKVGFNEVIFYYPLPDYKMPIELFSDEYLPTMRHNIRSHIFPSLDYLQSREFLFNEKLAMNEIIKNKKFDFFANSFLIFARN